MVVQRQNGKQQIDAALNELAEPLTQRDMKMATLQGGCLCGAIHYHSDTTPSKMIASDCRHCQKQAGAAIAISVGITADSLKVEGLRPSVYEDIRDSGAVVLRSFCPKCGTPLFSESDEHPELVFIKTASLDDPSAIEPKATPSAIGKRYRYSAVVQRPSRNVAELPAFDTRPKVS